MTAQCVCHVGSHVLGSRDLGRDTTVAATGKKMVIDAMGMEKEWKREKVERTAGGPGGSTGEEGSGSHGKKEGVVNSAQYHREDSTGG